VLLEPLGEDEDAPLGDEDAPPLGLELVPPEEPEVLGCALELELELGEAELAPPEAEPDFELSLEADPLIPEDELLEAPGELGLDDAPPEGDEDDVPLEGDEDDELLEGDDGELDGEVLELDEPDELLPALSPRSHAARPKASATATARAENFMCPPWVGSLRVRKGEQQDPRPA
jgi:hypothetical protein